MTNTEQGKRQINAWLTKYNLFLNDVTDAEIERIAAAYHAAIGTDHEQAIAEDTERTVAILRKEYRNAEPSMRGDIIWRLALLGDDVYNRVNLSEDTEDDTEGDHVIAEDDTEEDARRIAALREQYRHAADSRTRMDIIWQLAALGDDVVEFTSASEAIASEQ